jgi:hypothetical protein
LQRIDLRNSHEGGILGARHGGRCLSLERTARTEIVSPTPKKGADVMLKSNCLKFVTVWLVICIVFSLAAVVGPGVANPAKAADDGDTVELFYDDGIVVAFLKEVCGSCETYEGVKFSLPEGMQSATLTSVRFYFNPGAGGSAFQLHITGADPTKDLIPFQEYQANGKGWATVAVPEVSVGKDFWVIIRRMKAPASVAYDQFNNNLRSFSGSDPSALSQWQRGDLFIRASIRADLHVGFDQPYKTIQSAVDAALPGMFIIVHPGTYPENVKVDKSRITIRSMSGADETTVQTSNGEDVFHVTGDQVTISGFTIKNAGQSGTTGVHLEGANVCSIRRNNILAHDFGILVEQDSESSVIRNNQLYGNTHAVWIEGINSEVSGNVIYSNVGVLGSALHVGPLATGTVVHFNRISGNSIPGQTARAVLNENTAYPLLATWNWWGAAAGPVHTSNPGGTGDAIGDSITFTPWFTVPPVAVETETTTEGTYALDAKIETQITVIKTGDGLPTIWVASFESDPTDAFPSKYVSRWSDVLVNDVSGVEELEIRLHYTTDEISALNLKEGSLRVYWWNGEEWKACSKGSVDKANDFVWAKVKLGSRPGLSDMTGTMFAIGTAKGGIGLWSILLVILLVLVLIVAFRLFWVAVVKRGRYSED